MRYQDHSSALLLVLLAGCSTLPSLHRAGHDDASFESPTPRETELAQPASPAPATNDVAQLELARALRVPLALRSVHIAPTAHEVLPQTWNEFGPWLSRRTGLDIRFSDRALEDLIELPLDSFGLMTNFDRLPVGRRLTLLTEVSEHTILTITENGAVLLQRDEWPAWVREHASIEFELLRERVLERIEVELSSPMQSDSVAGPDVLRIQGRALYRTNRGERIPINEPMRVKAYLAQDPEQEVMVPGTPEGHDSNWFMARASQWQRPLESAIQADGSFEFQVLRSSLRRPIGVRARFDVALSWIDLAPSQESMEWTHHWVAIDGAEPIPPPMQSLARVQTGAWRRGAPYDPVALVRAVNELVAMGKDKALETLRAFARRAPESDGQSIGPWDGQSFDQADRQAIFLVAQFLFVATDATDMQSDTVVRAEVGTDQNARVYLYRGRPFPWIGLFASTVSGPDDPFVMSGDLPFLAPAWIDGRTGCDPDPLALLDWAEKHATMRSMPLRPVDDPFAAIRAVDSSGATFRVQLAPAMAKALGLEVNDASSGGGFLSTMGEVDWTELERRAKERGLHWDEARQGYAAGFANR